MPTRRLPKSATARLKALSIAKEMKDAVPPPLIIPFKASTIASLDSFYPQYELKVNAMEAALVTQGAATSLVKQTRQMAEWLILDFYDALQRAIRRGAFPVEVRPGYGLGLMDANLPMLVA